jgi:hypothetical protein
MEHQHLIKVPNQTIILGAETGRKLFVSGAETLPAKFLALTQFMIDALDHETGVPLEHPVSNLIVRKDGLPVDRQGAPRGGVFIYESESIVMNPFNIIDACHDRLMDPKKDMSHMAFRAMVWHNLLTTFMHEMRHGYQALEMLSAGREVSYDAEDELDADKWANAAVIEMAKTIDLELPSDDEFGPMLAQIRGFEKKFPKITKQWAVHQCLAMSDGYVFYDPDKDECHKTMREALEMASWGGEDKDQIADKAWQSPVEITPTLNSLSFIDESTMEKVRSVLDAEKAAKAAEETLAKAKEAKHKETEKAIEDLFQTKRQRLAAAINRGRGRAEDEAVSDEAVEIYLLGSNGSLAQLRQQAIDEIMSTDVEVPTAPVDEVPTAPVDEVPMAPTEEIPTVPVENVPPVPTYEPYEGYDDGGYPTEDYGEPVTENNAYSGPVPDHAAMQRQAAAESDACETKYKALIDSHGTVAPHDLTPEQVANIGEQVYKRLFMHIFDKCDFNPTVHTKYGFDEAKMVHATEPVLIGDIPGADKVFVQMTYKDANENFIDQAPMASPLGIYVRGDIWSKSKVLGYTFLVNAGDGKLRKRVFMTQNINTQSQTAARARQGERRMFVIDDDRDKSVPKGVNEPRKWLFHVVQAGPGQPIEYIKKQQVKR